METYRGHVRNSADAIKLFEACRRGLLPRVQRRLSEKERQSITSGSVFVWDEREAGMRRWTDGKSWSASRVSGSFLTYREMEGKRGGGNFVPAPRRLGGKTPDSGRASDEDAEIDGDGDGYRYKADGLMKQSFSITTSEGQHLHLISYYARPHSNMAELLQPSTDPALRNVVPPKGMYPESTTHESAPQMRSLPLQHSYMSSPQHALGAPQHGIPRMGYAYQQGYPPWPPSPMSTPPYGYPPNAYSQLPPPMNGHQGSYHSQHHLPPHPQQHMPQAYDNRTPINLPPAGDRALFPGQLPQISANPYTHRPSSVPERHPSDAASSLSNQPRHLSQPVIDTRLPPPLQHQHSAPVARDEQSIGAVQHERTGSSQGVDPRLYQVPPMREEQSNVVDTRLPPPLQHQPLPPSMEQTTGHAQRRSPSRSREIAPDTAVRDGTASPSKRAYGSISTDEPSAVTPAVPEATKTPEMPPIVPVSEDSTRSGSRTPEKVPEATDIPHAKLAGGFAGVAGVAGEDLRAIRVLDRKFCI